MAINKIKLGMNTPISKKDKSKFLNESPDIISAKNMDINNKVGRPKLNPDDTTTKKTITMYNDDLIKLESLINRTIALGYKDKGVSGTIRMAIISLCNTNDSEFKNIYQKVK